MKVIRSPHELNEGKCVVALGMFDGVHIGHQSLIREAVRLAGEMNVPCVVCTFDRHPLSVLRPEMAPEALLSLDENLAKFALLGADYACVIAFTPEFAAMSPEDYLKSLVSDMGVCAIVAGENYTFGSRGRGNAEMLRAMQDELGYRAVIVPPVMDGDVMASSTRIRALLRMGETEHAKRLMDIID